MLVTKVSERVYQLDTMALGRSGTVSAFVIKGPKVAMVDCGYATSYRTVLEGLSELGVPPSDVRYLIPTHVHLDHAGAAGHLVRHMPNAEVIAQERGVPHLIDPSRLIDSATMVFGREIMEMYGVPEPIPAERVTPVGKELHLDLGDEMTATLLHAPGHAPHQVSVMLDRTRTLLTADAVGIVYPEMKSMIPTTPPPSFNPATLLASVDMLAQTDPTLLLVPHFGTREDVGRVFEETKTRVTEWVGRVGDMKKAGRTFDDIAEEMTARLAAEEGVDELPVFAKVSARTSVKGILHYLEKDH